MAKKKPKKPHGHGRSKAPVKAAKKRSPLLIGGAVVVVAAAIVLIVVLMSRTPERPPLGGSAPTETATQAQTQPRAQQNPEVLRANYDVLKTETIEAARQLVADFPGDAFPAGLMGTVLNQFGNSEEAEQWWQRCLDQDPARADAFEVLALAYLRKGQFDKVVDLSAEMLAVAPNTTGVHRRRAEALLELGELDAALDAIEKERRISPDLYEVYIVLARIQLQRKDYASAVAAYTRALELRPNDSKCYFGLAAASARLGQRDKSREYSAKFQELRAAEDEASTTKRRATDVIAHAGPILAETLVDAGRTYQAHGQLDKAEQLWRRAAEVDPANAGSRLQLISLYRRARRSQEAAELCRQLTQIEPHNGYYHYLTGVVLGDLRRFDDAERSLRRSIKLAPGRAQGYTSLAGLFLMSNRRLPEAVALAEKAVELAPSARHYTMLSQARSRNQEPAAALAAIERAVELDPNNAEIRKTYERLKREQ